MMSEAACVPHLPAPLPSSLASILEVPHGLGPPEPGAYKQLYQFARAF